MPETITLNMSSPILQYLCKKDKRLAKVISMIGSIEYQTHNDPYDFLVDQIIGQMLSAKVGDKIYSRLVDLCSGKITPETINNLTDSEIKNIGTSNSKVTFIRSLTNAFTAGEINFEELSEMEDKAVLAKLTSFHGIGKWTANMYLIFVLDRQDILPTNDVAFLQSYKWLYKAQDLSEQAVKIKCKKWKPYSSIAVRFLYRALDTGFTKKEFHLFK